MQREQLELVGRRLTAVNSKLQSLNESSQRYQKASPCNFLITFLVRNENDIKILSLKVISDDIELSVHAF